MPRHYFTEGDIARARLMREDGQSWNALARHYNCSEETIRRYMDDEYRKKRADRYRPEHLRFTMYGNPPRTTSAEARRVIASVPADTRSPVTRWMGDPLPGRSALDKMRASVMANSRSRTVLHTIHKTAFEAGENSGVTVAAHDSHRADPMQGDVPKGEME